MTIQAVDPQQIAATEAREAEGESFEAFKKSFAYGRRNDLLFKFIKNLSDEDAAEFLRGLLEKLGRTIDDGDLGRLYEHVYEWNVRGYVHEAADRWQYDTGPFAPLVKPLSECTLGLLTATGHFDARDDPEPFGVKNMTQAEAIPRIMEFIRSEPTLSTIPLDTPRAELRVRHPGYDIRGAVADPNVNFPIHRLAELEREGVIGHLLPDAFSFVGATAQTPRLKKHAPQWAGMLQERGVDAMLLVPA